MTESEWLQCTDPNPMLRWLCGQAGNERNLRLFGCACCRRIWHLLPHKWNRKLVVAVEEQPAGTFDDLERAIVDSSKVEDRFGSDDAYWAAKFLGRGYYKLNPVSSAFAVAWKAASRMREEYGTESEKSIQADLLRDLIPNPFQPSPLVDSTWLTWNGGEILELAQSIHDEHAFDRLQGLADLLEQAGCRDPALLAHCRTHLPHARGCWAVDSLLGKY